MSPSAVVSIYQRTERRKFEDLVHFNNIFLTCREVVKNIAKDIRRLILRTEEGSNEEWQCLSRNS